jgi:lysophospholipase L1-like esterase
MSLPRLFVVGDSISLQYGPHLERLLAGRFHYARKTGEEEALRDLDQPAGANGGDSVRVRAYLAALRDGGGLAADLLLLNCGLHDIRIAPDGEGPQVPPAAYRENLEAILDLAEALGAAPAWVRTTPVADAIHNRRADFRRRAADVEAYNRIADAVMAGRGVPVADLHACTRNLGAPEEIFCDHVHFTEPVRRQQAAFLAGWLDAWRGGCRRG